MIFTTGRACPCQNGERPIDSLICLLTTLNICGHLGYSIIGVYLYRYIDHLGSRVTRIVVSSLTVKFTWDPMKQAHMESFGV